MSRNHLKVMMLCWALLVIAIIWIDRWGVTLVFGAATCLGGIIVLAITAGVIGSDRKESRGVGLLFTIVGSFLVLLQMIDRFIIGHR